jgi:hypothetical protein
MFFLVPTRFSSEKLEATFVWKMHTESSVRAKVVNATNT